MDIAETIGLGAGAGRHHHALAGKFDDGGAHAQLRRPSGKTCDRSRYRPESSRRETRPDVCRAARKPRLWSRARAGAGRRCPSRAPKSVRIRHSRKRRRGRTAASYCFSKVPRHRLEGIEREGAAFEWDVEMVGLAAELDRDKGLDLDPAFGTGEREIGTHLLGRGFQRSSDMRKLRFASERPPAKCAHRPGARR